MADLPRSDDRRSCRIDEGTGPGLTVETAIGSTRPPGLLSHCRFPWDLRDLTGASGNPRTATRVEREIRPPRRRPPSRKEPAMAKSVQEPRRTGRTWTKWILIGASVGVVAF